MKRLLFPTLFFLAGAVTCWELLRFLSSHPSRVYGVPLDDNVIVLFDGEPREDWRDWTEQEDVDRWGDNGGANV